MAAGEIPAHSPLMLQKPIPDLAEQEFHLFQALVLRESGIHLGVKNRAMLVSCLWKRFRALELSSFSAVLGLECRGARNGSRGQGLGTCFVRIQAWRKNRWCAGGLSMEISSQRL